MSDRSPARNVFIELASEPGTIQAGLCAVRNLTRAQFLDMLRVLFVPPNGFHVCEWGSATPISPTSQVLRHGRYVVHSSIEGQEVSVSNERYFPRTISLESTASTERFRDQVRHRDRRCVITHNRALDADNDRWTGFQAAHIYPRSISELFTVHGFANKLTYDISEGVNSPQNGILLRQDIHALWDSYELAVNPDAGYRVHACRPSTWEFHNRTMHMCCRLPNQPQKVLDVLLRWHFEQAVLCNMRGASEPMWEFDFPPSSDMVGEILRGPLPAQRMEVELFEWSHGHGGGISQEYSEKDEDGDGE